MKSAFFLAEFFWRREVQDSFLCDVLDQTDTCDMRLAESAGKCMWFRVWAGRMRACVRKWNGGTYCYCVVVFDIEIIVVVEEESVILAVALVGHGFDCAASSA
jgi:hypothetical protein